MLVSTVNNHITMVTKTLHMPDRVCEYEYVSVSVSVSVRVLVYAHALANMHTTLTHDTHDPL